MMGSTDILVIEDEPLVANAVVKVCGADDLPVTVAESAIEGLKWLEKKHFRLVLSDIMLPEMDGFGFLQEVNDRGLDIPVVMMTGYSTMENAVKSLNLGAVDYIPKPFTADELLSVVYRSLRSGTLLRKANLSSNGSGHDDMTYVFPPSDFYRLGHISWVMLEDEGTARIGLNDLFFKSIEQPQSIELSEVGEELVQGTYCAMVRSASGWQHQVLCPMGGEILEVNEQVKTRLSLLEKDPYFRGWLYRILPAHPESNLRWLSL
jgi:CheY-like chemotaxis protein